MATQLGQITVGFFDSTNVQASTNIPVTIDDTATLATIINQANVIAGATIALSEDAVSEVRLTVTLTNPGPTTPTADSDSNEGLLVNVNVTGTKYPLEVWIPAMIDALLVNGKVDLSNTTLTDWETDLTVGAQVKGANKYGMVVTTIRDGAESFRKLGRQSVKKTRSKR